MTTLAAVAKKGSRLKSLEALRDYLADALDQTMSARDQASLSKQYMDCLAQIEELAPKTQEVDELDSLIPSG